MSQKVVCASVRPYLQLYTSTKIFAAAQIGISVDPDLEKPFVRDTMLFPSGCSYRGSLVYFSKRVVTEPDKTSA